jgi:hypothetical protein
MLWFKKISPKHLCREKNWTIFTHITDIKVAKKDHNIGFQDKRQVFRRKWTKIAENR